WMTATHATPWISAVSTLPPGPLAWVPKRADPGRSLCPSAGVGCPRRIVARRSTLKIIGNYSKQCVTGSIFIQEGIAMAFGRFCPSIISILLVVGDFATYTQLGEGSNGKDRKNPTQAIVDLKGEWQQESRIVLGKTMEDRPGVRLRVAKGM